MARLPVPGQDNGTWGDVLNEFLTTSHTQQGTLKSNVVGSTEIQDGSIVNSKLASGISADKISDGVTNKSFTATHKNKLDTLSPVAVTGSYADLVNTPAIPGDATLIIASDAPSKWQECAGIHLTGTNDSAALAVAINDGPVVLSPGTFIIDTPISITNPYPSIVGHGWTSILKIPNGMNDWAIIFVPGGSGIRGQFSSFTIDGNASNQTNGGGIHARGSVQSEYHYIHFLNCYETGLWLDKFPDNSFGHHNKVLSCLFDNTIASSGIGRGMLLTSNDENYVRSEFQFLGGTGTPTYAIKDQSGLNTYHGSIFVGGRNNMGGIELRDGQRSKITGCTFDGVSGNNIFVASSSGHIITNNTLTSIADQAGSDGQYAGIYLEYAVTQCLVLSNVFDTSSTAGRTRSLIREDSSGGSGLNIIKHNVLRQQNAGTPSVSYMELSGTGSLVNENIVNGVII
jgi:hypothetical protein